MMCLVGQFMFCMFFFWYIAESSEYYFFLKVLKTLFCIAASGFDRNNILIYFNNSISIFTFTLTSEYCSFSVIGLLLFQTGGLFSTCLE